MERTRGQKGRHQGRRPVVMGEDGGKTTKGAVTAVLDSMLRLLYGLRCGKGEADIKQGSECALCMIPGRIWEILTAEMRKKCGRFGDVFEGKKMRWQGM